MKTSRQSQHWTFIAASMACALITGCASVLTPATPEEAVKERAQTLLKAKRAGEFEKAYNMTAPGFRAVTKLNRFQSENIGAPTWVNAEVVNVSCEEPVKCTTTTLITVKPLLGRRFGDTMSTHVDETWLKEDGQWWLFPKL